MPDCFAQEARPFESRKRDAHREKAGHAKQPSRTLNATVRPSSEDATSKEANGIVCATGWQVQAVAKRDRAWQHHAPTAQHDTHPYARNSNLVCCVMCVCKKLRRARRAPHSNQGGATHIAKRQDTRNSQAGRSTQQCLTAAHVRASVEWLQQEIKSKTSALQCALGPGLAAQHLKYLLSPAHQYAVPRFYGLIKVHKDPPTIRPIAASHSAMTAPLARVGAHELQRALDSLATSVLASSQDLIRELEALRLDRKLAPNSVWFVWGDVTGLYSNLPIQQLLDVIAKHLQAPAGTSQAAWFWLLHWTLRKLFTTCVVQQNVKFYKQIHGIAMGSPLSPVASNLFLALLQDTNGTFECSGQPLWDCLGSQERLAHMKRYILGWKC